jgi:drug/metabolite transporter (DMT)-like permease
MNSLHSGRTTWAGIGFAVLATILWSGNFTIARGIKDVMPPVSVAFYRWCCASLLLLPLVWRQFRKELPVVKAHKNYVLWVAFLGVTLFNTLAYFAGHYTSAINLALIGTTSSPVFAIIMAAIFLKEQIRPVQVAGLLLCLTGIVFLIAEGSWEKLMAFRFSPGDVLILLAGFCFAVYNILVRRKPVGFSPVNFLFVIFTAGTLMLLPAWLIEISYMPPVKWSWQLVLIILYLGLGTSVLAFLCWNAAIARLGAGRTALFGNLIPVFSSLQAVWLLNEQLTLIHLFSGLAVIAGVLIANLQKKKR